MEHISNCWEHFSCDAIECHLIASSLNAQLSNSKKKVQFQVILALPVFVSWIYLHIYLQNSNNSNKQPINN